MVWSQPEAQKPEPMLASKFGSTALGEIKLNKLRPFLPPVLPPLLPLPLPLPLLLLLLLVALLLPLLVALPVSVLHLPLSRKLD